MTKEEILAWKPYQWKYAVWQAFGISVKDEKDILAAWQVVERVGGAWDIKKRYRPHPDDPSGTGGRATYQAIVFTSDYDFYEDELVNKRLGRSPWCWSLPEAICKAALLTKLDEIKEVEKG